MWQSGSLKGESTRLQTLNQLTSIENLVTYMVGFVIVFGNFGAFNQLSSGYYCDVSGERSAKRLLGFGTVGVSVVHSRCVLVTVIRCHSVGNISIKSTFVLFLFTLLLNYHLELWMLRI